MRNWIDLFENIREVGIIPTMVQQVRDKATPDFAGACEAAAHDLVALLQNAGVEAIAVEGGYNQPMSWGDGEQHPWTPHWWVVAGDLILDPTREQFGSHELITAIDDPAYLKVNIGIEESYVSGFTGIKGAEVVIYRNPTRKEWKECQQHDEVRAFIVGNDILIWNPYVALHQMVRDELSLGNDAISIMIEGNFGDGCYVSVTDNTRNTPWWHNPAVIDAIEDCGFMASKFPTIEIGFYDEAIVGSWDELDEDEDDI